MHPPAISVAIGVYNGARYLRPSLESILGQQDVDFELVVVDDGSTDESPGILDTYARRDPRLRVLRQANSGLTKALIRGCAEARGAYIARQDADDLSSPGRLARLAARLDAAPDVVLASSWAQVIGPQDEVIAEIRRPQDPAEATRLLRSGRQGPPGHGSVMFRKDAYMRAGGYRDVFYYAQDSDLWLRMIELGSIRYEPAFLYRYRYAPDSISALRARLQAGFADIAEACRVARVRGDPEGPHLDRAARLREDILARRVAPATPRDVARAYYFIGAGLARHGDRRGAAGYFRKAWQADRGHVLALLRWLCPGMHG